MDVDKGCFAIILLLANEVSSLSNEELRQRMIESIMGDINGKCHYLQDRVL